MRGKLADKAGGRTRRAPFRASPRSVKVKKPGTAAIRAGVRTKLPMTSKELTGISIWRLLKQTFDNWMEDNCLRLSAALAYYSIFSIAPLLVIAIAIAGFFFGAEAASGQIQEQMKGYVGSQAAQAVQTMVQSASKPSDSKFAGVIGIITLLFGATGVFGQLKDSLNTIWEVKQKPGSGLKAFIRERILSFGMVLVIGFLLLVSLLLTAALGAANLYFGHILQMPAIVWGAIGFLTSMAVVSVLFATIFKVLPDASVEWRNVWTGAIVTALLFETGKFALGWYLGRESTASPYGAAGSVVLLLLWVYYASLILFFGAEFTQVYSLATGSRIEPAPYAEPATAETRMHEGLEVKSSTPEPAWPGPAPRKESVAPLAWKTSVPPSRPETQPLLIALGAGLGVGLLVRWARTPREKPIDLVKRGLKGVAARSGAKLMGHAADAAEKARDWAVRR